jgi:glyoxylase-like metal-dependent hydrolase (beta-lactamase superfamily II)
MPYNIQHTQLVSDGLYLLNFGYVASYVLDAGDSLVAFDAGMIQTMLLTQMRRLNLDASKVGNVFFTHSDPDHIGGMKGFPNARAHISRDETAMLDGTTPRFFGKVYSKPLSFDYELLEDGQEITIGTARIKCIATAGHTSGSMSYLINDSILVVGDEMNLKKGKAVLDFKLISIDNAKRKESITKLASLKGIKLLCTAHSGFTDSFEVAMEGWV